MFLRRLILPIVLVLIVSCSNRGTTDADLKVAFIADQGIEDSSRAVLTLIQDENAEMVLHQGDLDYIDSPDQWDQMITDILGIDFPYFVSVGNHDVKEWDRYANLLSTRILRVSQADCNGDIGINMACSYRGLFFVLSGIGTLGSDHINFLENALSKNNAIWKICSWHKNQRLMQVGNKEDETGWEPYELCRNHGAVIATGHEHSYSRTHLLTRFNDPVVASPSDILILRPGQTFAFVNGLGGRNIRGQNEELAQNPWWDTVLTSKQGANYGALFCTFHVDGKPDKAHCYFKDIEGIIRDEFTLISES